MTQLESLKRKCAKAGKKVAGGGGGGGGAGGRKGSLGGILKKGSWKGKSKTSPNDSPLDSPTAVEGSPGRGEMGEEDEEDEDDDGRRGEVTWAEVRNIPLIFLPCPPSHLPPVSCAEPFFPAFFVMFFSFLFRDPYSRAADTDVHPPLLHLYPP